MKLSLDVLPYIWSVFRGGRDCRRSSLRQHVVGHCRRNAALYGSTTAVVTWGQAHTVKLSLDVLPYRWSVIRHFRGVREFHDSAHQAEEAFWGEGFGWRLRRREGHRGCLNGCGASSAGASYRRIGGRRSSHCRRSDVRQRVLHYRRSSRCRRDGFRLRAIRLRRISDCLGSRNRHDFRRFAIQLNRNSGCQRNSHCRRVDFRQRARHCRRNSYCRRRSFRQRAISFRRSHCRGADFRQRATHCRRNSHCRRRSSPACCDLPED